MYDKCLLLRGVYANLEAFAVHVAPLRYVLFVCVYTRLNNIFKKKKHYTRNCIVCIYIVRYKRTYLCNCAMCHHIKLTLKCDVYLIYSLMRFAFACDFDSVCVCEVTMT